MAEFVLFLIIYGCVAGAIYHFGKFVAFYQMAKRFKHYDGGCQHSAITCAYCKERRYER